MSLRDLLAGAGVVADSGPEPCTCASSWDGDTLVLDAGDCAGRGDLAVSAACRATAVRALRSADADAVVTRTGALERRYTDLAPKLLSAAADFADRIEDREDFGPTAESDPLAAAHGAQIRGGAFARAAAASGLADAAAGTAYADFRPQVGPTVSHARFADPPADATLNDERSLDTGAEACIYTEPGRELRRYHLSPVEAGLDAAACTTLAAARERLAESDADPTDAVRTVAGSGQDTTSLAAVLRKHTVGYGALADFFADERVTDVFATAPVGEHPLRVRLRGETMRTNVTLPAEGAEALASRLRGASGRAFSRADPTLDATIEDVPGAGRIRAAGVTDPVSDGAGFAFRAHGREAFTLPRLVANDTLTAEAAGLLSLAVEHSAAGLVAGPRGAGKTTLLGALLWELPAATRLVAIEDTPELPLETMREHGRDAQGLRTELNGGGLSPAEAVHTALRLGDGALVVGEIRGEEAPALYEAMRVGARGDTVLGTVHGADGEAVRERVVADLGVEPAAFGATDFVVSLAPAAGDHGVARVEEVVGGADPRFEALYDAAGGELAGTGRLDRGNSRLLAELARPGERYGEVRDALAARAAFLDDLATTGRTRPEDVVSAHAARRGPGR